MLGTNGYPRCHPKYLLKALSNRKTLLKKITVFSRCLLLFFHKQSSEVHSILRFICFHQPQTLYYKATKCTILLINASVILSSFYQFTKRLVNHKNIQRILESITSSALIKIPAYCSPTSSERSISENSFSSSRLILREILRKPL